MPRNLAEVQAELARVSNAAKAMLARALRAGTINQATHDQLVREVSDSGDPEKVVTITLRVREADKLAGRTDVNSQVERALAGLARQAGAQVVAGSVAVNLDGDTPTTEIPVAEPVADEPEDCEDTSDEYDPADAEGQTVTITARFTEEPMVFHGGVARQVNQEVERALSALGRQHGVEMVAGSTAVDVRGRTATITHRATGETYLVSRGAQRIEDELSNLLRARGLGVYLERGSVTARVG